MIRGLGIRRGDFERLTGRDVCAGRTEPWHRSDSVPLCLLPGEQFRRIGGDHRGCMRALRKTRARESLAGFEVNKNTLMKRTEREVRAPGQCGSGNLERAVWPGKLVTLRADLGSAQPHLLGARELGGSAFDDSEEVE